MFDKTYYIRVTSEEDPKYLHFPVSVPSSVLPGIRIMSAWSDNEFVYKVYERKGEQAKDLMWSAKDLWNIKVLSIYKSHIKIFRQFTISRYCSFLARKTISRHDRDCLSSFDARLRKWKRMIRLPIMEFIPERPRHSYPRIQALLHAMHDFSDCGSLSTQARIDNSSQIA